ncbi:MAG: carbohydrate ABC transporter permease [Geminicoccaceae bacterium]
MSRVKPRTMKPGEERNPLIDGFWSIVAIIVALIFFFPIYWAVSNSLRKPAETFTVAGLGVPFVDFTPTLENWNRQFAVPETYDAFINSTMIASASVGLALILGLPAAYALARFQFFGIPNRDITIWFLSQRVLPPVATAVPFFLLFSTIGLLDTPLALILVNATFILPFCVVICRQTFYDLPIELEEAALVDGATYFTAFLRVALPLAAPAITAAALIMFAFAWNEYLFAVILTIKEAATMPVHIAGGVDTRGVQFWFVAVRSLIAMVPPVLLALFAQRYIVRGLTLGAVKG